MPQQSIAIAGAGLLGRLLAWRCAEQGHRVTLFEAGSFAQARSAAHTAAAMIAPLSEVVVSERLVYDMGMRSLTLWPRWIDALNCRLPENEKIAYHASGSIAVAHPQDLAELRQFKQDLTAHLGADDNSAWLTQQQLAQKEGALSQFQQALWLPDEAYLDNRRLLDVLLDRAMQLNAQCIDNHPLRLDKDGVSGLNDSQLRDHDWIIDCRGLGAKQDFPKLRGVRGEVLWVETAEVQLRHPVRLMHPRYKLYIVPKPKQRFIIGATEIESEDQSAISLQSHMELSSALYTINPAFAEARIIETDVNLRPAFADNLPRIEHRDRVIRINGLYRHGYLLAPTMVQKVLDIVADERAANGIHQNPATAEVTHAAH